MAQQRLRQFDQALESLGRAGGASAGNAMVAYQMGATHAFAQRWPQAVEQLDRATGMDPAIAYAYFYRGLAQEKQGRKDLLIRDLERFVAVAPDAPEADQARAILRSVKR